MLRQIFPGGLQPTVQRQLNRLSPQMYALLTAAAVAGPAVDVSLLSQLIVDEGVDFSVEDWLICCVSAAILQIEKAHVCFAEDTVRQVLLDSLALADKQQWQIKIAQALEVVYGEDPAQAAVLAYHWQQVGDVAKEQKYARLAGEYAGRQFAYDTAVHYLSRALDLTPQTNLPERYALLLAREKQFHILGNRDAQKDDLIQIAELADQLPEGEQAWRIDAALRLGAFAEVTGEYTIAIVAATEALKMAQTTRSAAHEAAGNLLWGQALLRRGKYSESEEKLMLSRTLAVANHLLQTEADSLRFLGVWAADQGKFDHASASYEAALAIYQTLSDKRSESTVLNNLSIVAYAQNQLVQAMAHWEQALEVYQTIGDREGMARVLSNLSSVCLDLGDYEKGQAFSQEALTICRELDLRFGQGMNLINLSLFGYYLGANQQADIFSQAAIDLAQQMKSTPLEGLALKDRAYLLLQQQQLAAAAQTYQQGLAIWQELAQPLQILEMQAGLGRVALAQNDMDAMDANMQPLLAHWEAEKSFAGTSRPFFIYLALVEMLTVNGHARATDVLAQAQTQLNRFAEKIENPLQKQTFFQDVAEHRQIMALVL